MIDRISRRCFIGAAGVATAASATASGPTLPLREFGNTGVQVPVLALGCGNRLWAAYRSMDRGLEALELALSSGIRYFDTAQGYGDGKSESWVGEATKNRRGEVFLSTKTQARTYEDVLSRCEESLKRLQTDRLDVLHIHNLSYDDDLKRLEKDGAIKALQRLREEKTVRFIGITSHCDPVTLAQAIERHDFDCTQVALNAGLQGRSPDGDGYWKVGGEDDIFGEPLAPRPHPGSSFEEVALPVAVKHGLGVIGMKVTGQEGLVGEAPGKANAASLIRYVLSLPVSMVSIGMPTLEMIRENAQLARDFQPMSKAEMRTLSGRLARENKAALDHHFNDEHQDA
jgi:predicted aldo/keto reductase-like oxidoreductase